MESKENFQKKEVDNLLSKSVTEENVSKKKNKHRKKKATNCDSAANTFPVDSFEQREFASLADANSKLRDGESEAVRCEDDDESSAIRTNEQDCNFQVQLCTDNQSSESIKKRKKRKNRKRKSKIPASLEHAALQESDISPIVYKNDEENTSEAVSVEHDEGDRVLVVLKCDDGSYSTDETKRVKNDSEACEVHKLDIEENDSMSPKRADHISYPSVIFQADQERFESAEKDETQFLESEEQKANVPVLHENGEQLFDDSKSHLSEEGNCDPVTNENNDLSSDQVPQEYNVQNNNDLALCDSEEDNNKNNEQVHDDSLTVKSKDQNDNDPLSNEGDYDTGNLVFDGIDDEGTVATNNTENGVVILESNDQVHDSLADEKTQGDSVACKIDETELNDSCCITAPPENCSHNYEIAIPKNSNQSCFDPLSSENDSSHDTSVTSIASENDFPEAKKSNNQNSGGLGSNDEDNRTENVDIQENVDQIIHFSENPAGVDHCFSCKSFPQVDENERKHLLTPETEDQGNKIVSILKLDEQGCRDPTALQNFKVAAAKYLQKDGRQVVIFGQEKQKDEDVINLSQDQKNSDDLTDESPFVLMSSFAKKIDSPSSSSQAIHRNHRRPQGPSKSVKRPPSRGELMPHKRRKNDVEPKSKGLIEKFAAVQVLCFILACHAFCALLSVFKRKIKQVCSQ